ncbi:MULTISPECIES: acyl-CoA dehydrogenase family protein [Henriciella]|uniref:acyl-CoA dehydrogenase family protein n=1 Tax=Henriciella TaxID=453849 RepID=UPI0035166923
MQGATRFALEREPANEAPVPMRDFAFEVDDFLARDLTEDLRDAGRRTTGLKSDPAACKVWRERLRRKGWLAPSWPVEYGGPGWTVEQRLWFERACADNDAPVLMSSGIRTIGPLIISMGTPEQKHRYLPAILSGRHEWCQGFSEPQAGSDLTALSLKAELDGDDFILNGTKLWTSFAQTATHMFLLARSERNSSGRDGIVFLLVDLSLPGIKVQPIRCIDGSAEVSEVFFDNVRTPARDRIAAIGEGWKAARKLMEIARSNNTTTGVLRAAWRSAKRHVLALDIPDEALLSRLAGLDADIQAFEALEGRLASGHPFLKPASRASLIKLRATELRQQITEIGLAAQPNHPLAQTQYFSTRAATIYSGTSEIHRNGLAHAIGCP